MRKGLITWFSFSVSIQLFLFIAYYKDLDLCDISYLHTSFNKNDWHKIIKIL